MFLCKATGLQQPSAELPGTGRNRESRGAGGQKGLAQMGGKRGAARRSLPRHGRHSLASRAHPRGDESQRRIPKQPPAAPQRLACSSKSAQAAPEAQAGSDAEAEGGGSGSRKKKLTLKSEIKELLFHISSPSISISWWHSCCQHQYRMGPQPGGTGEMHPGGGGKLRAAQTEMPKATSHGSRARMLLSPPSHAAGTWHDAATASTTLLIATSTIPTHPPVWPSLGTGVPMSPVSLGSLSGWAPRTRRERSL